MTHRKFWLAASVITVAFISSAWADPLQLETLRSSFHPYSTGPLHYQGITPGMTINQQNWRIVEQLLPAEVAPLLQAGEVTITVQETTDLPLRETYIAATMTNFTKVSLNGGYKIDHYQGGKPFPLLDPTDPRAGEKAAWNFHYRDTPHTLEMRGTMDGVSNTGWVDRSSTGRMRVRYGMDRVGNEENDPQWESQGIRTKASFEALSPSDLEGNMRITTYYDDQQQPSVDLMYSPQNRRTRKSYVNMLTRMGGGRYDVLQEEQPPFFFTGYLHNYEWTYRGEKIMLVPGFLQADHITFGGRNDWYPNVPWELRKVIILESTPKGAHPYSKRIFYLDAQTYAPLCVISYDTEGAFIRLSLIAHGNPDFVPGSNGIRLPVPLGATWINFSQEQAYRMTADSPTFNEDFSPRRFELMELLRKGK